MISVIIGTKNGSKFITRALESIIKQIDVDLEIIVVSDGSTDSTSEVVRSFATEHSLVPLHLIELTKNIGPGLARNLAILGGEAEGQTYPECKGEYVAIIDDDDMWQNEAKLKNQLAHLKSDPALVLVGSEKTEFARENGEHIRWIINQKDPEVVRQNMLCYNPVITSSVLFRKDIFKKAGGFKNMYLAEDYDLWLRMGQLGKISNTEDAETQYTVREGSASKSRRLEMTVTVLNLVNQYRDSYPDHLKAQVKAYARIAATYLRS